MRRPTSNFRLDFEGPPEGRYQILGRIASGAMGQIYLARVRLADGRTKEVALKRLKPELQRDRGFQEMFYDEIRVASRMQHPNIIRLLEYGELDGSIFYAMELVPGVNLSEVIRHAFETNQRIPLEIVLSIGVQILDALDYAHNFTDEDGQQLHLVHRDVSPQNVLLSYGGAVKLLDFGVTKAEGQLHKTQPGMIKGKLAYMAPEQIRSEPIDARADLFALGITLYEAALLHHPFPGRTDPAIITSIMRHQPPAPHELDPQFPRRVSDILMKAMAKEAAERFESADAMRRAIVAFQDVRGWSSSHEALERFLAERFADRIEALSQAKSGDDDVELVHALEAGTKKALPDIPQLLAPPALPIDPSNETTSEEIVPPSVRMRTSLDTGDLMAHPEQRVQVGVRIGRYSLIERIHAGTREILLAHGERGRRVAIKRLAGWQRAGASTELLDELSIAIDLAHPGLIGLIEIGEHQDETYAVMELVRGVSIDEILERCAHRRARMPIGVSCRIAADLCRTLHYLHTRAILHRDVSRKHVLVTESGEVKLTHPRARSPASPYTAPERLAPNLGPETPASDLYSVGVLLLECLSTNEGIALPPELDDIVVRAMDRAPDRRHESARLLAAELERFLYQKAEPVTPLEVADWLAQLPPRTA